MLFKKNVKGATLRSQRFPDDFEVNIQNYYPKQLGLSLGC